jgi:hypothetical protein
MLLKPTKKAYLASVYDSGHVIDVFHWWLSRAARWSELVTLAMFFLCRGCTSVPCEVTFSSIRRSLGLFRHSLLTRHVWFEVLIQQQHPEKARALFLRNAPEERPPEPGGRPDHHPDTEEVGM